MKLQTDTLSAIGRLMFIITLGLLIINPLYKHYETKYILLAYTLASATSFISMRLFMFSYILVAIGTVVYYFAI